MVADLLAPGCLVLPTPAIMMYLKKQGGKYPYPPSVNDSQEDFVEFFTEK